MGGRSGIMMWSGVRDVKDLNLIENLWMVDGKGR